MLYLYPLPDEVPPPQKTFTRNETNDRLSAALISAIDKYQCTKTSLPVLGRHLHDSKDVHVYPLARIEQVNDGSSSTLSEVRGAVRTAIVATLGTNFALLQERPSLLQYQRLRDLEKRLSHSNVLISELVDKKCREFQLQSVSDPHGLDSQRFQALVTIDLARIAVFNTFQSALFSSDLRYTNSDTLTQDIRKIESDVHTAQSVLVSALNTNPIRQLKMYLRPL